MGERGKIEPEFKTIHEFIRWLNTQTEKESSRGNSQEKAKDDDSNG